MSHAAHRYVRLMLGIAALAVVAGGGALLMRSAGPAAAESGSPPVPALAGLEPRTGLTYRGVALQVHRGEEYLSEYFEMIDEIAGLGANCVLLGCPARMEHAKSQALFLDVRETLPPDKFVQLIEYAKQRGLMTILMPVVLLKHPRGSEWRGLIEPPNWTQWWSDYRALVGHFADIANRSQAHALMVGSELISTEKNLSEWVRVIELARQRFPGGKLGYSANWDHYRPVQFWDRLDLVGMTSYYTLSKSKAPSVEELTAAWTPIREELLTWGRSIGKPIILTEVGWCSQEGAAGAPWNYYQNQRATPAGDEEQRRLYEAFMRAWDGARGLSGVIWWEWTRGPDNPFGYTPQGKPAEQLLRDWFKRQRAASPGEVQLGAGS